MIPFGYFDFSCQDDLVLKAEIDDVPYFNAPIFLENKSQIGKIDEIFGTLRDYSVSVKLSDNMKASSFVPKQKLFIDPAKLLPLQRFLPQPPKPKIGKKKGDKSGKPNDGNSFGGRGGGRGGFSKFYKFIEYCLVLTISICHRSWWSRWWWRFLRTWLKSRRKFQ